MFPGYEGSIGNITDGVMQSLQNDPRLSANKAAEVKDPDKVFAGVTQRQADRYERDFKPFETDLVRRTQTDTSIVDTVPEDVAQQQRIAEDVSRRNRERFGFESTAALSQERQRALQRGGAINLAGGLNEARLAQLNQNQKVLSDLINIGSYIQSICFLTKTPSGSCSEACLIGLYIRIAFMPVTPDCI